MELPPCPAMQDTFFSYEPDSEVMQGKKKRKNMDKKSGAELCFSFKNRYIEACVCLFLLGVFVLLLKREQLK